MTDSDRVLGIDYGTKRIGFATGDTLLGIATPHSVARVQDEDHAVAEIKRMVLETEAGRVVVGYPISMDGTESEWTQKVGAVIARLSGELSVPVVQCDERLTSQQVQRVLRKRLSLLASDL